MPLPQTTSTSAPAPAPESSSTSAPNETQTTETVQGSTPGAGAAVGTDVEAGAGTSSGTAVDADSDDDGVSIRISRPIGPVAAGTSTDNDAWDDDDEGTSYGPLSLGSSYFDSSSKGPAYAQICHQKTEKNSYFGTYKLAREFNVEAVGTPVLISVPTELTIGEARTMVLQAIAPFLRAEPLAPIAAAAAAITAMESAGEPPFRIVVLDQGARNCAKCSLGLGCDGCELAGDDNALLSKEYKGRVAFGIRWSAHQFERYYINKGKYETLHEHETVKQIREAERDTSKEVVRLEDCIHLFTQEETLSKEDPWYCSTCKDFVQANKKFDLWRLPNIFVVHLKRFSFTRMWRDKLDTLVDFPIEGLDVSQFCANAEEKNTMYDLYAISNHYGGMGGGHYTAYCKNLRNGKWYHHDDSHVSPVSEKELKTSAAYVLYYRRRQD